MDNKNFWKQGSRIGVFFVILFVICFAWFYVRNGGPELKELHSSLFALSFFGWSGMNIVSFLLGIAQSFIWGFVLVILWDLSGAFFKKHTK